MFQLTRWPLLVDEVNGCEQTDPNDVDEVPVVRHDDRADLLFPGEALGGVSTPEQEEEREQTTGHVQSVEPSGYVEHGPVVARRERQVVDLDELRPLVRLPEHEVQAHDEGQDVPLAQSPAPELKKALCTPDLAALDREDSHLARDTRCHEHEGVRRRQRKVKMRLRPGKALALVYRADREVHRKQRSKE